MLEEGVAPDDMEKQLDFTQFEERFTGGDAYIKGYYNDWFEQPLRKAAIKELSGKPMKEIEPSDVVE